MQQIRGTDKVYEQSNGKNGTVSSINKHPLRRFREMEKVEKVQTERNKRARAQMPPPQR